jgi:glycerol-3-phosphate O-acyltransferase
VPAAFVCTAVMHGEAGSEALAVVQRRFDFLADLFVQEFFFHPDLPTDFQLQQAVRQLQEQGILRVRTDDEGEAAEGPGPWIDELDGEDVTLELVDRGSAWLLASTIRNFIEAYYVVLEGSQVLRRKPLTRKELVAETLKTGRRMFLTEDVTRPEAIGKVNLDNAARQFLSKGVLVEMHSYRGKDPRLVLDEDAREKYLEPMGRLFRSGPSRSEEAR